MLQLFSYDDSDECDDDERVGETAELFTTVVVAVNDDDLMTDDVVSSCERIFMTVLIGSRCKFILIGSTFRLSSVDVAASFCTEDVVG